MRKRVIIHRNILCISSSAWITIIVASVALQVVSNVLYKKYRKDDEDENGDDDDDYEEEDEKYHRSIRCTSKTSDDFEEDDITSSHEDNCPHIS